MIFQRASQETTGRMLVSTLMSHFASLHVLLITDSISSLFVSVALKQTFYYWCPCYYSWGLQSFWMSLWARNQIVNCRYTELDICDPVDCPSSRRSEFKPPWQNASILLKCPWAKTCESLLNRPRCSVTDPVPLPLCRREANKQLNLPSYTDQLNIARQHCVILLNRCENSKRIYFFISCLPWKKKKKKHRTRNYALCSSGNAKGVCSNYSLSLSKAVDSLSSN